MMGKCEPIKLQALALALALALVQAAELQWALLPPPPQTRNRRGRWWPFRSGAGYPTRAAAHPTAILHTWP